MTPLKCHSFNYFYFTFPDSSGFGREREVDRRAFEEATLCQKRLNGGQIGGKVLLLLGREMQNIFSSGNGFLT